MGAARFDHHIWGADYGGSQDGAVEHRYRDRDFCEVESVWRVVQTVESRADADPTIGLPRRAAVVIRDYRQRWLAKWPAHLRRPVQPGAHLRNCDLRHRCLD